MNLFKTDKKEGIFLILLILAYGFVAYFNLGSTGTPETYYITDDTHPAAVIEVEGQPRHFVFHAPINDLTKYIGIRLMGSADGENWTEIINNTQVDGYTAAMMWFNYEISPNSDIRYFRVEKMDNNTRLALNEIGFLDSEGNLLRVTPMNEGAKFLVDEQDSIETDQTHMNSAYFDESYFGPSFIEMQDGLQVAEMDHPPVGRLMIGIGMSVFGRSPLGFRFMQATFGILMLPLIYYFARALFNSKKWAGLAAIVLSLDFLHYTQTRIGTLDAFLVFFILAMYTFLFFFKISETRRSRFTYLALSGFFMGLAIGTKWSACYAAAGMALLYFIWLFGDLRKGTVEEKKERINETIWCVITFVVLPATIYILSYIPYVNTLSSDTGLLKGVVDHARQMFGYHTGSSTNYEHPYSSKWWTWFLALKPVFYYYKSVPETVYIYGTGNPMVWGLGLLGCFYSLFQGIRKTDIKPLVIAIGYFSQLIPWLFITRDTFLYHYFPLIPFLILGVGYLFKDSVKMPVMERVKKGYIIGFLILALVGFVLAFPYLYGSPMTWDTVLLVRRLLLILAGIACGSWLILMAIDYQREKKSRCEEKMAEDTDQTMIENHDQKIDIKE